MAGKKKGEGGESSPPRIEDDLSYADLLSGMAANILKLDPTAMAMCRENPGLIEVREWLRFDNLPHYTALLGGGYPVGTITEIYGEHGTGKSTLAYLHLQQTQEQGGIAILLDSEGSITLDRLEELGVNTSGGNFRYWAVPTIEACDRMINTILTNLSMDTKQKPMVTIVVDSLAHISTNKELEGELTDQDMAWKPRLINKMLRRITESLKGNRVNLIFCNQTYSKMGGAGFGGPTTDTPGGRVLKFVCTQRIECKRVGQIKIPEDPDPIGHIMELMNFKCRTARPRRKIRCAVIYSHEGLSGQWSVFQQLSWKERAKALIAAGAYWSFSPAAQKAVTGIPDKKFLKKNWPEVYAENREAIDELAVLSVNETF